MSISFSVRLQNSKKIYGLYDYDYLSQQYWIIWKIGVIPVPPAIMYRFWYFL
jgi:hypothetical protein